MCRPHSIFTPPETLITQLPFFFSRLACEATWRGARVQPAASETKLIEAKPMKHPVPLPGAPELDADWPTLSVLSRRYIYRALHHTHGIKTRAFGDILSELRQSWRIHRALGSCLGAVHFELTGEQVTECLGGSQGLGGVVANVSFSRATEHTTSEQAARSRYRSGQVSSCLATARDRWRGLWKVGP